MGLQLRDGVDRSLHFPLGPRPPCFLNSTRRFNNLGNTHRRLISLRARNWLYARWMTDAARLLLDAPRRREQRQANAAILKSRSKTRPLSRRPAIDAVGFT